MSSQVPFRIETEDYVDGAQLDCHFFYLYREFLSLGRCPSQWNGNNLFSPFVALISSLLSSVLFPE
jgi:hypothetical protein